jgi:hypothetical protein
LLGAVLTLLFLPARPLEPEERVALYGEPTPDVVG